MDSVMNSIELVDCVLAEHSVQIINGDIVNYKSPGYIRVKCSCDCIIKIKEGKVKLCPNCENKFKYNENFQA